jgi:hypothetical protein
MASVYDPTADEDLEVNGALPDEETDAPPDEQTEEPPMARADRAPPLPAEPSAQVGADEGDNSPQAMAARRAAYQERVRQAGGRHVMVIQAGDRPPQYAAYGPGGLEQFGYTRPGPISEDEYLARVQQGLPMSQREINQLEHQQMELARVLQDPRFDDRTRRQLALALDASIRVGQARLARQQGELRQKVLQQQLDLRKQAAGARLADGSLNHKWVEENTHTLPNGDLLVPEITADGGLRMQHVRSSTAGAKAGATPQQIVDEAYKRMLADQKAYASMDPISKAKASAPGGLKEYVDKVKAEHEEKAKAVRELQGAMPPDQPAAPTAGPGAGAGSAGARSPGGGQPQSPGEQLTAHVLHINGYAASLAKDIDGIENPVERESKRSDLRRLVGLLHSYGGPGAAQRTPAIATEIESLRSRLKTKWPAEGKPRAADPNNPERFRLNAKFE